MHAISDRINETLHRLTESMDILSFIDANNSDLAEKHWAFFSSLIDLYSRDIVSTINSLFEKNEQDASLFTLCNFVTESTEREKFKTQIEEAQKNMVRIQETRNKMVLQKSIEEIERIYWELKEYLKIDGTLFVYNGAALKDLQSLLACED